jgi:alpha-mannosidase
MLRHIQFQLLALAVTAAVVPQARGYDLTKDKVQYICCFAHLDAQFLYTWETSINEYVPNSFHENFPLMDKYPEYKYNFTGAWKYMEAKRKHPEDYAKLKTYIAKGQWIPSGALLEDPDLNIPSPESLIRHVLYGNDFFEEEFGYTTRDILLPDDFGFPYVLPTVASQCNMIGFSTQKLSWGSTVSPLPFDIGVWEGVDGAQIIACLGGGDYWSSWAIKDDQINRLGNDCGLWASFDYFAPASDRGGAPPEDQVASMCDRIRSNDNETVKLLCTKSDQIYEDLWPLKDKLKKYKGELLLRSHGVGCFTGRAWMKQWNRQNEQLTLASEAASLIASHAAGYPYPADSIKSAAIRYLWHQMHDDLTGTSIVEAYEQYSIPDETSAIKSFNAVLNKSIAETAKILDTRGDNGVAVAVFNSLGHGRTDLVETSVTFSGTAPGKIKAVGPDGAEEPAQILSQSGTAATVLFNATVPAAGYAVYRIVADDAVQQQTELTVDNGTLESDRYRVSIDQNGDISGIYDKSIQKELLAQPARLQMFNDRPPGFPMWEIALGDISGDPRGYVDQSVQKKVVEQGPVRVALEVSREKDGSKFVQTYSLAAGGEHLEVKTFIDWNSPSTLCKAAFILNASNAKATYDLGIGTIDRGNNRDNSYEVPAQQWADLTNAAGDYGVGVMNDCKYGWDKPADNTIRMTLVHFPSEPWRDNNNDVPFSQTFKYAIVGHQGDWKAAEMVSKAARFNRPLVALQEPAHDGKLGKEFSLITLGSPKVALMAFKKAEKSDDVIVRVRETTGSPIDNASITFPGNILAASEVYGTERARGTATFANNMLTFSLKGYEPKSFSVKLGEISAAAVGISPAAAGTGLLSRRVCFSAPGAKTAFMLEGDEVVERAAIRRLDGRMVAAILGRNSGAGEPVPLNWNGRTSVNGNPAAPGMYLVEVTTGRRMLVAPFNIVR